MTEECRIVIEISGQIDNQCIKLFTVILYQSNVIWAKNDMLYFVYQIFKEGELQYQTTVRVPNS